VLTSSWMLQCWWGQGKATGDAGQALRNQWVQVASAVGWRAGSQCWVGTPRGSLKRVVH
jgi:hypothetical protein